MRSSGKQGEIPAIQSLALGGGDDDLVGSRDNLSSVIEAAGDAVNDSALVREPIRQKKQNLPPAAKPCTP
jgi:hypothetical protein